MHHVTVHTQSKWLTATLILLLTTLTVLNVFNLYRIHQLENKQIQTLYKAEAMYQRNLGELTSSVTTIHHQLAQLLVTSSKEQLLYGLSNLWREVYAAIHSLGALPVAMHQLEQTDFLLHDMAEYSYHLMKKNVLPQQPLSATDWNHLEDFYHRAEVVQKELEHLETTMLSQNFHLADFSSDDETTPLYTAFQNIENQVSAFPAIQLEDGIRKIEPTQSPIAGAYISESEAIVNANAFMQSLMKLQNTTVNEKQLANGNIAFTINNTVIPVYGVAFEGNHYVEVSQAGGHILQYYHTREAKHQLYTIEEAKTQAYNILTALQFHNMICVEEQTDDTTASFIFVPQQGQVYLYPDMVKLQLALDDGTLLTFDQTSYQAHHCNRTLSSPALSEEDILKNRNPKFEVNDIHLALIMDTYSNHELLAYELHGKIKEDSFSIFVDAFTGEELRIIHI